MGQQLCQDATNSPAEAANLCLAPCQHTCEGGIRPTLPDASEHSSYARMLPLGPKVRLTTTAPILLPLSQG